MANEQNKGFYKLSWLQRIGFGSGDLAQNLIFQVTCTYLTFFYTDIYGLDPLAVTLMLTVGNVANVIWDPIVGALIDKNNPKLGKYRSYLLYVGIPQEYEAQDRFAIFQRTIEIPHDVTQFFQAFFLMSYVK